MICMGTAATGQTVLTASFPGVAVNIFNQMSSLNKLSSRYFGFKKWLHSVLFFISVPTVARHF